MQIRITLTPRFNCYWDELYFPEDVKAALERAKPELENILKKELEQDVTSICNFN